MQAASQSQFSSAETSSFFVRSGFRGSDCWPLDFSVPDCFFCAMAALSYASDGPIHTIHGSIDRLNEFRPDVLELAWTVRKGRAARESKLSVASDL